MRQIFVGVNDDYSTRFFNHKEAITFVMSVAISHHKFSPLATLKENAQEACDLIIEFVSLLKDEETSKSARMSLSHLIVKMKTLKSLLPKINSTDRFFKIWTETILSVEGKGILHGFGFGSKKFKDRPPGNPEIISVKKVM
jgi:hypothetical protein